jgi:translocation and assembly module TamB
VQDVTATVSKDLVASFDGSLIYKGTREAQMIIGELNVRKARYTEKMDLPSLIMKARQRERPKAEMTKLEETGLNVRVLEPHVVVNNNLVRASLNVDLLIKGTLGQPVPFGKVEARDGVIYFMGNEYALTKARIDFTDPRQINPYFDVSGETKVSSYSIRLALSGFVDRFNLSLTSTPALSESDIFSLLTVGYVGARPTQTDGGSSLAGAGTFLAGQLTSTMEERLKTVSGLDRIQVDSYTTRTGTMEPRVSVAKRLWGDRIYVSYGTTLRSAAETGTIQVWKVEYILTKNVSLVGTRDELGGIGADLKFRFEFK